MDMHSVGQIARLKEELNTVRRQDTGSQQIIPDERTRATQPGGETAQLTPRKRKRAQSPGSGEQEEAGSSNDRPVRRARTTSGGFSREKIREVLGGSDRGWGSTMSR